MSRQDPGAATGAGVYPPTRRCVCGESEMVHNLTGGTRRGCPASGCRRFEPSGQVLVTFAGLSAWATPEEAGRMVPGG